MTAKELLDKNAVLAAFMSAPKHTINVFRNRSMPLNDGNALFQSLSNKFDMENQHITHRLIFFNPRNIGSFSIKSNGDISTFHSAK